EALLKRGADLELVFPFRLDEFRDVSVRPAGEAWILRFERCLEKARSTTFATDDSYLGDEYLFTYTSGLGIGLALQRPQSLHTDARLLAVWDGGGPGGQSPRPARRVTSAPRHPPGRPPSARHPPAQPPNPR